MSSLNQQVMADVLRWLQAGEPVWLCTILTTWGSSPRPAGSLLAVSRGGAWSGSISGGCLEEALIRQVVSGAATDGVVRFTHGISTEEQAQFRLPCGGRLELLLERLLPEADEAHIADIHKALRQRQRVTRWVCLESRTRGLQPLPQAPGVEFDASRILHTLGPQSRLLLVGAGEVARYTARFALAADFAVALCEPREAFREGWSEADVPLLACLPDDLIREHYQSRHDAILALAHDPRVDDMALLEALRAPAFFVGAMGSLRTSAARRQRLYELGLDKSALSRLHAPVGFAIGSKTPAEIALSIMAQLVAERYRLLVRPVTL